jgi:hypothetical protein
MSVIGRDGAPRRAMKLSASRRNSKQLLHIYSFQERLKFHVYQLPSLADVC